MAYRLDPTLPVGDEVRRVAGEQLEKAVGRLRTEPEPAVADVHAARTSLKKTRSLLRLVRSELGDRTWRGIDIGLRDCGRDLSALRDADVGTATFDALAVELVGIVDVGTMARVTSVLADDAASARARARDSSTAGIVADDLAATLHHTHCWHIRDRGFAALERGVERQYRLGRSALASLGKSPDDEELHDLRKRSKDLWYHLLLLGPAWAPVTEVLAEQAHHLSNLLGDDHDLAVLHETLTVRHRRVACEGETALVAAIDEKRSAIQAEARAAAARLFADKPGPWVARLRTWWDVDGDPESHR